MKKLLIFMTVALLLVSTALVVSMKNQGSLIPRSWLSFINGNVNTSSNGTTNSNNTITNNSNSEIKNNSNDDIKITEEKAREIALNKIDGEIVRFEKDFDDNTPKYEIEIHKDTSEYDIEIDAENGEIIGFEESPIND